jgi:hypothetical protein
MSKVVGDPGVFDARYWTYVTATIHGRLDRIAEQREIWLLRPVRPAVIEDLCFLLQNLSEADSTHPPSIIEDVGSPLFRERVHRYERWVRNTELLIQVWTDKDIHTAGELRELLQKIHQAGVGQQDTDRVNDLSEDDDD